MSALLVGVAAASGAVHTVKQDGSGTFSTIQACANAAVASDTCLVYAGRYDEHVKTASAGTSETNRITFKAQGVVTMQGFDIAHPYVTVEGFDITGYAARYRGMITVLSGGNRCRLVKNILRDGADDVYGIHFQSSGGQAASNCLVLENRLSNLSGHFLQMNGDSHVVDGNVLEYQNSMDYIRLFGANHLFRRNVFWKGTLKAGTGNHPDFVQTFGGAGTRSENHVFEENWIQDLQSQFSQFNNGDGVTSKGVLYDNVKNVVFRRNVIVNVSHNANMGMPGVRFENNTTYRLSYELSGLAYSGSLTRSDSSRAVLKNNVFLAGGSRASMTNGTSGFYANSGGTLSRQVITVFVTRETDSAGNLTYDGPLTTGMFEELKSNTYIDPNGKILDRARALTSISQFVLSDHYSGSYKQALYDTLMRTVQLDTSVRATFDVDHNFVAGAESAGFPGKRSSGCGDSANFADFNFCEPHGINGGDPRLRDLANPLGPDGIPFTLDDGLKPLPTSPLCGKGENGTDIGAYSCDPGKVFSDGTAPLPPANLRIVPD